MGQPPPNKVEMRPAFAWDCPECGREHFTRAIVPEFSAVEFEELRSEYGVQPWEVGHFAMKPTTVYCSHCRIDFETDDFEIEVDS